MSKSNYLENAILGHELGVATYTPAATQYLALFSAAPNDAGGGTELSGSGYARKAVTLAGAWAAPSGGQSSNANAISFNQASGDWLQATHFAIFDASSAGNMLRWGALTTPKTVLSGDIASFAAGAIVITED